MVSHIKNWLKKQFVHLTFLNKGLGGLLHKFFKNDRVGFFGIMGIALLLIILKGPSSSEGQASYFNNSFASYIEETTASVIDELPNHQLADINSVFAHSLGSNTIQRLSILSTIQDNSIVSRGTILTDIINEFSGSEITIYEVQEGDTLSFIASDYGVRVSTIIASNNLRNADDISPGTKLKIPPVDGIIYTIKKGDTIDKLAQKYSAEADKIINFNGLPQEGDLQVGMEIIIPGGKIRLDDTTAASVKNTAKRFGYLPDLGGFFALPATGFNWGIIHGRNGVDIANSCGTPIYASADGSVALTKTSGWNGGFGKYIKIIHSNGTETLYAHLTKVLTSVGNFVSKNQEIGLMGSTGRSTGCHLHFEVHGAKNPLIKR